MKNFIKFNTIEDATKTLQEIVNDRNLPVPVRAMVLEYIASNTVEIDGKEKRLSYWQNLMDGDFYIDERK